MEESSDQYVTALSETPNNRSDEEETQIQPEAPATFQNFIHPKMYIEVPSSTPKRSFSPILKKRVLCLKEPESPQCSPGGSVIPESKLIQPKPIELSPWSMTVRAAIQARDERLKKAAPRPPPRMSMRI